MTIPKYQGEWNLLTAKHLLNRATFSITHDSIESMAALGLDAAVDRLLMDHPLPSPPVNPEYDDIPNVPIGETWVDKPERDQDRTFWWRTTRHWGLKSMLEDGSSIREKMTLFLHNHFVSAQQDEPMKYRYQYHDLLRRFSTGNMRELTKQITVNASMLRFLNGEQNTSEAPNENYARELFELFTIGKGPTVGTGDYSTYTEEDVLAAAKVLTGWSTDFSSETPGLPQPIFNDDLHDQSSKQLSHYFNSVIIENSGAQEYKELIDIIFEADETSRRIVRDLYIWFVHYDISPLVEAEVIEPLAQLFRDENFELKPVLRQLLLSEHFYDLDIIGGMIKSPFDLVVGFTNTFEIKVPDTLLEEARLLYGLTFNIQDMGQAMSRQPTVAGWRAYHQNPGFYEYWLDSITLPMRMAFLEGAMNSGLTIIFQAYQVDVLSFIQNLDDVTNPNQLIRGITDVLFSFSIDDDRLSYFKNVLIPGLPDFEWSVEYSEYVSDPDNVDKRLPVENRVRALLTSIVTSPEFQLH